MRRTTYDIASWRAAASHSFGTLEVSAPSAHDFKAEMYQTTVGEVSLFDMHTMPHTVVRTVPMDTPNDAPFCKLSLQISGTSTMTQDGRTCQLNPGDLALYVTQRDYTLEYTSNQETLIVLFPQSYLNLPPKRIEELTAIPISKDDGLGKVAIPLFEQLARNLDELEGPMPLR